MIVLDFLLGYFSSIIPSQILSDAYYDNKKKGIDIDFDYVSALRNTPLFFGLVNVIIMSLIDRVFENNNWNLSYRFLFIGVIIGLIYSMIGRFYLQIPKKLLHMKDPILFNVMAIFIWTTAYFVLYWVRDNIIDV